MKNLIIIVLSFFLMGCTIPFGIVATTQTADEENPLKGLVGKQISEVDAIMKESYSVGIAIGVELNQFVFADQTTATEGEYMNSVIKPMFKGEFWKPDDVKFDKSKKYDMTFYTGFVFTKFPTSYIPGVGSWIDLDTTDDAQCIVLHSSKVVSHIICGIKMDDTDVHLMTFADPPEGVVILKE